MTAPPPENSGSGGPQPAPDQPEKWHVWSRQTWDAVYDPPGVQPAPPSPEPTDYFTAPLNPQDPRAPWGRNERGNPWYPRMADGDRHLMTSPVFLACMAGFAVAVIIAVVIVFA